MDIRYLWSFLRSVFGFRPGRIWPVRAAVVFPSTAIILVLILTAFGVPGAFGSMTFGKRDAADQLIMRAVEVSHALKSVENVYVDDVEPLARVILEYRNDDRLARRVATALVREGRRADVSPNMLLAVLLVENPWINPAARSPVGAHGLMQVMPGHRGQWKACPNSIDDIESNICYGAQIFRSYLQEEHGQVESALLRYNGCVHGSNTPNCRAYPSAVFARAGRASLMHRPAQSASD